MQSAERSAGQQADTGTLGTDRLGDLDGDAGAALVAGAMGVRADVGVRDEELLEQVAVGAVDLDAVGDTRYQPPKSLEGSTISADDIRRRQPFCGADKKSPAG
jgi:hypothetical protein